MEIFLFYISQYWIYVLVVVFLLGISFLCKNTRFDNFSGNFFKLAVIIAVVLFTGVGLIIKPFFTNFDQYANALKKEGYIPTKYGTGSFINQNDVLTNHHVVNGCKELFIFAKNKVYQGKVIAILKREDGDLAFIRTNANEKNFALFSQRAPKINDVVFLPNYTDNPGKFDKAQGKITNVAKGVQGLGFLAPKCRQGNSGSPLYDNKGFIIGVVNSGSFFSLMQYSYAADLSIVSDFAARNNVPIFYARNTDLNLTKRDDFLDRFAVNVVCAKKN